MIYHNHKERIWKENAAIWAHPILTADLAEEKQAQRAFLCEV